jgi:hypothetical protein
MFDGISLTVEFISGTALILPIPSVSLLLMRIRHSRTSTSGREGNTCEAPAYRVILLNVAHSAFE